MAKAPRRKGSHIGSLSNALQGVQNTLQALTALSNRDIEISFEFGSYSLKNGTIVTLVPSETKADLLIAIPQIGGGVKTYTLEEFWAIGTAISEDTQIALSKVAPNNNGQIMTAQGQIRNVGGGGGAGGGGGGVIYGSPASEVKDPFTSILTQVAGYRSILGAKVILSAWEAEGYGCTLNVLAENKPASELSTPISFLKPREKSDNIVESELLPLPVTLFLGIDDNRMGWRLCLDHSDAMLGFADWNDTEGILGLATASLDVEGCQSLLALTDPAEASRLVNLEKKFIEEQIFFQEAIKHEIGAEQVNAIDKVLAQVASDCSTLSTQIMSEKREVRSSIDHSYCYDNCSAKKRSPVTLGTTYAISVSYARYRFTGWIDRIFKHEEKLKVAVKRRWEQAVVALNAMGYEVSPDNREEDKGSDYPISVVITRDAEFYLKYKSTDYYMNTWRRRYRGTSRIFR